MRLSNRNRIPALAVAALLLVGGAGCGSKKNLDKNVDRLLKALQKGDYAGFKAMSNKDVVEEFTPEKFKNLSAALNSLGSFEERTMKGIQVKAGGLREGRYVLRFAKGKVRLRLTLKKGTLIGFEFKGDDLKKAMRTVVNARYAVFKVGAFEWRNTANKPRASNVFKPGEPIRFGLAVWGMKVAAGKMKLKVDLLVTTGGERVIHKPDFIKSDIALPSGQPPVATVTGNLRVPRPAAYLLKLKITDLAANRTITHQQAFRVTGPPRPR